MTATLSDIKSGDLQAWDSDKSITVSIKRRVNQAEDSTFELTYTINSGNGPFKPTNEGLTEENQTKYQLEKTATENIYTFSLAEVLDEKDATGTTYTYYAVETAAGTGTYVTHYGTVSGETVTYKQDSKQAQDGQVIINQETGGYVLPQTGGIGTSLFTTLGAILTSTAGAALVLKKRKEEYKTKGRGGRRNMRSGETCSLCGDDGLDWSNQWREIFGTPVDREQAK